MLCQVLSRALGTGDDSGASLLCKSSQPREGRGGTLTYKCISEAALGRARLIREAEASAGTRSRIVRGLSQSVPQRRLSSQNKLGGTEHWATVLPAAPVAGSQGE